MKHHAHDNDGAEHHDCHSTGSAFITVGKTKYSMSKLKEEEDRQCQAFEEWKRQMLELLAQHNKEREIAARPKYILLFQQAKAFAMKDNI